MTIVVAHLRARAERADRLEEALRGVADLTRDEAGALGYAVCRHDGGRFTVVEQYADRAACEAHFAADHVTALLARFPDLLAGEPVVEIAEPVAGFRR